MPNRTEAWWRDNRAIKDLRSSIAGTAVLQSDIGYDTYRQSFNARVDRRPGLIIRCSRLGDIAAGLDFARAYCQAVAVRGGGHNPAGHCVNDGGLVIDLSELNQVCVDANLKVARVSGGATWADLDAATQQYGLAAPGGVVGSTGVAGLTLGGGFGHLTAQLGLSCDNLVSADVVSQDGQVIRASETADADLLWGLRGGGGNFGVVASLELKLHPVTSVVGGFLRYAGPSVADVFRRIRDVLAANPTDLSCELLLGANHDGNAELSVVPCYTGPHDANPVTSLRAMPGLVHDDFRIRPYLSQQGLFPEHFGINRVYWKSQFVSGLPDSLIGLLLDYVHSLGSLSGQILVESLHGAPKQTDVTQSAVGFRRAAFNVTAMAAWKEEALDTEHVQWAEQIAKLLMPWSACGSYINYMSEFESPASLEATYGLDTFSRLRSLKARYDPTNTFAYNQNVPPGE